MHFPDLISFKHLPAKAICTSDEAEAIEEQLIVPSDAKQPFEQ